MRTRSPRARLALTAALALGLTVAAGPAAVSVPDEDKAPNERAESPPAEDVVSGQAGEVDVATPAEELPESASGLWIVQLDEPALATYRGGTNGLRATSPDATGEPELDPDSAASRAYLEHLAQLQEELGLDMEAQLGHDIEVEATYQHALNGMAVRLDAEEAQLLADLPGVASVEPDQEWEIETDVSNDILSSPAIWEGETGQGVGTRGEGVVVGMLDTGVNPDHPSFAATDGDGYTHVNPYGSGTYVGVCADPAAGDYEDICNDKLIGAYNFTGTRSAADDNGHGSHTGSTMAGNKHDAVFSVGADEHTRPVAGVAPRANVISYKVCSFSCLSTSSVAAVNQAVIDGTDVLNYSISGPDNPWGNAVDAAFLAAYEAGIFVSASAGNDGPGAGTVAKTAPWNAAVAATNSPRLIAHGVSILGPEPVPEDVVGLAGVPGTGPGVTAPIEAELREASTVDEDNRRGCTDFPAGAFEGALALIERGDCNFSVKVDNAADAGAVGVVVANQFPGPPIVMGALESTDIPSVMVAQEEGTALREFVLAHPGARALLDSGSVLTMNEAWTTMVADFSSRGPSDFDLLAPTFAAPGRNILAATMAADGEPVRYEFMQGTSMAAPHGAGAGALLRALHPDWSPGQIRSALASTADPTDMLKDDGETAADPFDVGSGLLDLDAAGRVGLVMDESHADFVAADPDEGGDPRTLNLPAFVDQNCLDVCSFTREVTNVADTSTAYAAVVDAPAGVTLGVEPSQFTVEPGATQTLTVTADVSALVGGEHLFGDIALTTDGTHAGGADVADVHYPVVLVKAEAEIVVEPAELSSLLGVDEQATHTVSVSNAGGAPMEWSVAQDGECALPGWASAEPGSGTLASGESQEVTVVLDSSDLAGGSYQRDLCLASNDPHTPVATVAMTLEVVEIPVIEVDPQGLTPTQPAGTVTQDSLTVANTGYGVLDWTLADPEAGPSDERIEQLRDGVLLVPNSSRDHRGVMAFDPEDGTLLDTEFIPHHAYDTSTLYTPNHVLPKLDGTGFLVADQIQNVVTEYDLDGSFVGFFAPTKAGEDRSVMQNIRGMAWSPEGTLVVTVATGVNGGSLVEFDQDGSYLGHYVAPGLGGLDSPWFGLFRDGDLLVSDSTTRSVLSYRPDGTTANAPFATDVRWPEQIAQTEDGTVLVANWSTATGLLPRGVHEYSAGGEHLGHYAVAGSSSYAGVYPLGNGNVLTTTEDGVFEISRDGAVVEQEQTGGRPRFVSEVRMPDLLPCVTPGEVPWLTVDPGSGQTARGEVTEVALRFDSTGMQPGRHTVNLCVSSDDPATPYVPIPVTLTVTDASCDTTVSGVHSGPLTAGSGLTCLAAGAEVQGPVTVRGGALFADDTTVLGPLTGQSATGVEVTDSTTEGPVTLRRGTGVVRLDGNTVAGPVLLDRNSTGETPIVVAENTIDGALTCRNNTPPPTNEDRPNEVSGARTGQCRDL